MEYKIKEPKTSSNAKFEPVKLKHLASMSDTFAEHTNISDRYIGLIKSTIETEVFSKIDAATCCGDIGQYTRRACINYFSNKLKIGNVVLEQIQNSMKDNKDKSIFIPGVKAVAKTATKATRTKTATAALKKIKTPIKKVVKQKEAVVEVLVAQPETISATVDSQIMPVVSQIFKGAWADMAKKAKIVKPKRKRLKQAREH